MRSGGSQKNNLKVIKALFKFAKREGYITEDVAADVTLMRKYSDTMSAKILSVEEVKTLLKSVPKEYLAGFALMTFYGVRPGSTIRRITAGRQNTAEWIPRAYKGFESLNARTRA